MAFTTVDEAGVLEHLGIIGQRFCSFNQLTTSALIVTKRMVVVIRQCKVDFASIRLEAHSSIQSRLGEIETSRCMIMASKVGYAMHPGQQTPSLHKARISPDGFV